jgi:hypothetical protein
MSEYSIKKEKLKLKKTGIELYNKYFFNTASQLNYINECIREEKIIDFNKINTVFNVETTTQEQIYNLIRYYPNILKEKKIIDDDFIKNVYSEYGESIEIMESLISDKRENVRGRIIERLRKNAKERKLEFSLSSYDLKLVKKCPILEIELNYSNSCGMDNSPSIDRIDSSKGYIKGNITMISKLANQMKSSATKEQLNLFIKNINKIFEN